MKNDSLFKELLTFGNSPIHVVEFVEERLLSNGFSELKLNEKWDLASDAGYYVKQGASTVFAFTIPSDRRPAKMRIAAAHTDTPCFRIKANPEIIVNGYGQLNIEVYGGPILNSWLDRPLSIAGRVAVKGKNAFSPEEMMVDFRRPLLTIPNLAIHLNRDVNKGVELNRQTEMLPIMTLFEEGDFKKDFFMELLAGELGLSSEEILDFDLYLYCIEEPCSIGIKEEFLSASRLDNLTSCAALTEGILEGKSKDHINLIALFNHEEIGSKTNQGAASLVLRDLCEKIWMSLGADLLEARQYLYDSMMISADVAHATHPNYISKMDPTNLPIINQGICIKESSSQSYITDCVVVAVIQGICQEMGIPYQKFFNRSDSLGGNTLGAIASTIMPLKIVDIGVPILGMHSARELMGMQDMTSFIKLMNGYFTLE
ncbi:MAG: M18 family aminopeptidase [Lachnospiraceae bacterium]